LNAEIGNHFQFIRKGYFCLDKESTKEKLVFNRTVSLKDAWAKEVKK
jgi:glutaminyl-tRNA synthetase